MQTTITADRNGWLTITLPCGMQLIVPQDDNGTDDRVEIRHSGKRLWVEANGAAGLFATEQETLED